MDHGTLALLIPILAIGLPFGIALVAMLTKHQRDMAEMINRNQNPGLNDAVPQLMNELNALRQRVGLLNDRVNQLAIGADSRPLVAPPIESNIERQV